MLLGLVIVYLSFTGTFQSSTQTDLTQSKENKEKPKNALVTPHEQPGTNLTRSQEQPKIAVPVASVQSPLPQPLQTSIPITTTKAQTKPSVNRILPSIVPSNEPEQAKSTPFTGFQYPNRPYAPPSPDLPEGF
jgi:hypothetical protein